jgi:hypothetical protein
VIETLQNHFILFFIFIFYIITLIGEILPAKKTIVVFQDIDPSKCVEKKSDIHPTLTH